MGCLLALVAVFTPRLGVFLVWLARPTIFEAAFSPLFAIIGIIFVPFTTLIYALLWTPNGFDGLDWLWLALALAIDLGGGLAAGGGRFWRRGDVTQTPY